MLTPSVVGLDDSGTLLVGAAARERLISQPHLTAASFKRYMGTQQEVQLGPRRFRAEELSALVLRSLKQDAEAHVFLGGDDFRDQLVKVFLAEHGAALGIDPLNPQALLERVSRQAELAKRELSSAPQAHLRVAWEEKELRWEITAADFERHCESLSNSSIDRRAAPAVRCASWIPTTTSRPA